MEPERYREVERLYHLALDCEAGGRRAFLERVCGGDQTLLREVESLLAFQKPAERFMEIPASLATTALIDGDPLSTASPQAQPEVVGQTVGHYRIEKKLGEGGMGRVYAATDLRLDRQVAIKMLRTSSLDPQSARRLWREARTAASISHPNICQIYEVGDANGDLFIAMELLDGDSLAQRIGRGPLSVAEAIQIALEILAALSELQRRELVHRDLKPSNIVLTARGTKLLDFGLTRSAEASATPSAPTTQTAITQPGTLVGTPHYMSPEQIQGKPTDARADLFAAGAILFEMLTGKHAFPGTTMMDIFHAVVYEQPPVLGGSPAVSAVDRIVHRAMAKKPADRYQTADQMARELRTALLAEDTGEATRVRPITRLIVLPFRSLRPDEETDFLAFSLPDAITSTLAGLQALVVRSSAIASRFTDQALDLKRIATETEVDVVLTGTLLRGDDGLRVTAQLIEAPTGAVIWSRTTETRLRKIFEIQDDLVRQLVESLSLPLTAREERLLRHDAPVSATAYEFYLRGNQLTYDWHHHNLARDLYMKSLEHDPTFAPAWARLGRCCLVIGKLNGDDAHLAQAEEAFKRALELNSELALAHNFYARMEADRGQPLEAMTRLLHRAQSSRSDPELFASLVYVCRYCGLLTASVAAHDEARRLDPQARTSVARTYYIMGDYQRALETGIGDADIEARALAALGRRTDAIARLQEEERKDTLFPYLRLMFTSLRALLEGRESDSLMAIKNIGASFGSPEGRFYLAEHLAQLGETARALGMLDAVVDTGFFCYPGIAQDPWLDSLRTRPEFVRLLGRAEVRHQQAVVAFKEGGGEALCGVRI